MIKNVFLIASIRLFLLFLLVYPWLSKTKSSENWNCLQVFYSLTFFPLRLFVIPLCIRWMVDMPLIPVHSEAVWTTSHVINDKKVSSGTEHTHLILADKMINHDSNVTNELHINPYKYTHTHTDILEQCCPYANSEQKRSCGKNPSRLIRTYDRFR